MRTHTQIGAAILSNSEVPELQLAEAIALRSIARSPSSAPIATAGR